MSDTGPRPRIVILGSGFAGIHVAQELSRLLPREQEAEITLVDQNNFLLFTPMLTEVAGGTLDTRHCVSAIRHLSPRIRFEQGRVDEIDLEKKRVTIALGGVDDVPETRRTLEADQLVIALGSVTNFHHVEGVADHALTIKSLGDAAAIRNRALALLEAADAEPDPGKRRALLTIVVAGGGFSGVETMAAVNDMLRDEARYYPRVRPRDVRSVLAQPGGRLLPEIGERLASYAQKQLEKRGVEVRLNTEVGKAGQGFVELKAHDGKTERIDTHLLIWAAGVTPSPAVGKLDVKRGHHGGIAVDPTCAVPGHLGVWALGDCAEVPQPGGKKTYAPTAQNATREGALVAQNVAAALRGEQPRPFDYHPIGELAIVGKRSGVASVYGVHIAGPLAWLMWRGVYLAKMPRMAKRIRVVIDWMLDLFFGRELAELPGARSTGEAA